MTMTTTTECPIIVTIPQAAGRNPGWPGQPGRTRIAFLADLTIVRSTPSLQAPVLRNVSQDEEADLGASITAGGGKWCLVTFRDGKQGYIPAETPVRQLKF